ncbi:MAG: hypothetical protein KJO40_19555 [Deltaproteobacteria bacterium]|nr:hypothetical protein [Deltaproteobacteria bacterium]
MRQFALRAGLFGWFLAALAAVAVVDYRFLKLERRQERLPAAAGEACKRELAASTERIKRLEAAAQLIAVDVEVAHARIGDVLLALDAVAKTTPGRARAPQTPKRPRPSPSAANLLGDRARLEAADGTSSAVVHK